MTEPRFQRGDRVWFKVLATVTGTHPDASAITVKEVDGGGERVIDTNVTDVELQAPAGWPPQRGDLWTMRGTRWFVTANGPAIALVDKSGNRISAAEAACHARDLVLVEREQQDGTQRPSP